jgi:hypothetical protein
LAAFNKRMTAARTSRGIKRKSLQSGRADGILT